MRTTLLLLVAIAAATASASATNNRNCDPSYQCGFTHVDPSTSKAYTFDLSPLCSSIDYMMKDAVGHTYHFNICGMAKQACIPQGWIDVEHGEVVQTWGSVPPCGSPPACVNEKNQTVCCTAYCGVVGRSAPVWSLADPANPATGGIVAMLMSTPPANDNPFWCPFDPVTGNQYARKTYMRFSCDPAGNGLNLLGASQNTTEDCIYILNMSTPLACASLK